MDVVVSQFGVSPEICIDILRNPTKFLRVVCLQSKNGPKSSKHAAGVVQNHR
jgi:hypothetical protein